MMKSGVSLCVWSLAVIVAWGAASPSLAQEASPGSTLKKFRGDWACTFESPASLFGPLRGIELVTLDRSGNATGEETVVGADPFVALRTTFSGRMFPQANGSIQGVLTLHVVDPPGLPDQDFQIQCVGMDTQGDRYREMRCLDIFDQSDGSHVIGILTCKAR